MSFQYELLKDKIKINWKKNIDKLVRALKISDFTLFQLIMIILTLTKFFI